VLNLHLTHLRGAEAARLRAAQLRGALDWAGRDLSGALVVGGDLNATALCPELAPLGARPAASTLQPPRVGDPAHDGLAIDHCCLLQAGAWRAVAAHVGLDGSDRDGFRPSDHMAVVLDLEPAQRPQ
jgi:endonuclease/exonuclease/phosphatase family metal-dependent hydrolase